MIPSYGGYAWTGTEVIYISDLYADRQDFMDLPAEFRAALLIVGVS